MPLRRTLIALFLLALPHVVSAQQEPIPIVGRWNLRIVQPRDIPTMWLEVNRSGYRALVGRFVGRIGGARPISSVDWADGVARFTIPSEWDTSGDLRFEIRVEGDTLVGSAMGPRGLQWNFVGKRAPILRRPIPKAWTAPRSLFNGKDFTGWVPALTARKLPNFWIVRDGALVNTNVEGTNLRTEEVFQDFKLHLEFRLPKGASSGVFPRGRYWVILKEGADSIPFEGTTGAVHKFLVPSENAALGADVWQTLDITLVGRRIWIVVNGTPVITDQIIPGTTGSAIDGDESAPGPIMLQGEEQRVEFRNITISVPRVSSGPGAPRLEVSPETALVDEPVHTRITGVPAGARVVIEAVTPYRDRVLRSSATYIADQGGAVDLRAIAPEPGSSYSGVDAMGLFWSMRVDTAGPGNQASPREEWSPPEAYTVSLTASIGGTIVARARSRRLFAARDVVRRDISEDGVLARLYLPSRSSGRVPVVISLSGSEGGFENVRAPMLASHGFAALALAYFRAPGLPDELFDVPVETIERAVAWIRRRPELDSAAIAIRGSSRGAELALLAASRIPEIRAVVADAPSDVVGPGIDRAGRSRAASAWSWRGAPVPFLPQVDAPEFLEQFGRSGPPYRLRPLYEASRRDTASVRRARIGVETINGPILLTTGQDDQYWPSFDQAEAIVARLRSSGFRFSVRHTTHARAGHQILLPYLPTPPRTTGQFWSPGGTAEGYARADDASWRETLAFLRNALLPPAPRPPID